MEVKTEDDPEKIEVKGARKRKSTVVTRIIQNIDYSDEEYETKTKKIKNYKINEVSYPLSLIENIKQEINEEESILENGPLLKEPVQRVTLVERALGSFSSVNDQVAQNTPFNQSTITGPPFTCVICNSWFYVGDKLKLHYVVNHDVYHCDICTSLFENEEERDEHGERVHHTVQCEICQDELGRHDIWFHYDQDHDAVPCFYCGVLRPKSDYEQHFITAHKCVRDFSNDDQEQIATIKSNEKTFYCTLCTKNRSTDIFFGHMRSFHKITTAQLLNIMSKQKISVTIDGTTVEERISQNQSEEILPIQPPRTKMSCDVCKVRYDKINAGFHHVYCQQKYQCHYCNHYFENEDRRDRHIKKNHSVFTCMYGCDVNDTTEQKLERHYLQYHEIVNCRYCEESLSEQEYDKHLTENHQYVANTMKNFVDTLFEVSESDMQHIVVCCLCDDNITNLTENVQKLFEHFNIEHNVSNKKILRLVTPKPSIADYEDFYDEINRSIDSDFNDKENSDIEKDFDPREIECVINRDINESFFTKCEFCNVDNISILDYLSHLKEKHKINCNSTEYECNFCSELFLNDINMKKHIFSIHEQVDLFENHNCCSERPYKFLAREHILEKHYDELESYDICDFGLKCRYCDKYFWKKSELNTHETSEHLLSNEEEFLKCPICFTSFSDQYCLKVHTDSEHCDYPKYSEICYKCLRCQIAYPSLTEIREHFRKLHPDLLLCKCPYTGCGKMYKLSRYLELHLKKKHKTMKNESFALMPCDVCGMKFNSVRSLNLHTVTRHKKDKLGFMCRICRERFQTNEQRKLHCATSHPGEVSYSCRDCGKGFVSKSGLYGHRKVHVENSVITCPYCTKQFTRRDSYSEHLLIHVGPKHQCPHCPKQFTQRSNLIRHVRIHTGSKPYSCRHCDKKFSDQGAKRSHERVHTKEEHCQCEHCGKKFTKWQKLKYHMKLHTGIGLVSCEVCQKQFTNNYSLNEHRRVHETSTAVMCECGKGFSSERYLQRHQQKMHGEGQGPKYACPICFKKLHRRSAFDDHMLMHTGDKQFICLLCGKCCYTRRTLKRHIAQKHDISPDEIDKHIQKKDEKFNLSKILNESELQVDIAQLESVNVRIKEEPEEDVNDEKDGDFVRERRKKGELKRPVRSSPRNKKNAVLYFTDFSDDEC